MIKTSSSPVYKIRLCLSLSLLFAPANTESSFLIFKLLNVKTKAFSYSNSEIESYILPFVAFLFTVPTASTFL